MNLSRVAWEILGLYNAVTVRGQNTIVSSYCTVQWIQNFVICNSAHLDSVTPPTQRTLIVEASPILKP